LQGGTPTIVNNFYAGTAGIAPQFGPTVDIAPRLLQPGFANRAIADYHLSAESAALQAGFAPIDQSLAGPRSDDKTTDIDQCSR
jgi:hypothetical protein